MKKVMYLVCVSTHDGEYIGQYEDDSNNPSRIFHSNEEAVKYQKETDSRPFADALFIFEVPVGD